MKGSLQNMIHTPLPASFCMLGSRQIESERVNTCFKKIVI